MDPKIDSYQLVCLGIALVAIGIAAVMIYLGSYLSAPENKRVSRAKYMRLYGLIFLFLSVAYLFFSLFALRI